MKKIMFLIGVLMLSLECFSQRIQPVASNYYFFSTKGYDLFNKTTTKAIPKNSIYVLYYEFMNTAFVYINRETLQVGDTLIKQDGSLVYLPCGKTPNYYKMLSWESIIIDSVYTTSNN
ncbi:MAG: hypothetical protein J5588_06295 [Bacteroidales bacterium]|nr:hypothetical protein [Bacteroidales bacterium]